MKYENFNKKNLNLEKMKIINLSVINGGGNDGQGDTKSNKPTCPPKDEDNFIDQ